MINQTAVEFLNERFTYIKWMRDRDEISSETGTKWYNEALEKAKEMEKEQMCNFAEFVATYPNKNININREMLHAKSKYDGAERTIDLLETFKSE